MGLFDYWPTTCSRCSCNFTIRIPVEAWGNAENSGWLRNALCPDCRIAMSRSPQDEIWHEALSCKSLLAEATADLLEYLGKRPERLHELPPRKFEELVASILSRAGYSVELTPLSHDHGVDVIAVSRSSMGLVERVLVQCKRFAPHRKIGIAEVQRMLGVLDNEGGTRALIATTSYFTREARGVEIHNLWRLSLHDFDAIRDWLTRFSGVN